jgi:Glycosyltransferase family 87
MIRSTAAVMGAIMPQAGNRPLRYGGHMASVVRGLLGSSSASPLERAARMVVVAILVAIGVDHVYFALVGWPLHDMDTYLAAATRMRSGLTVYVPGDVAVNSYWYAPWYAVAWIPFSYLPRIVVAVVWSAVLLAATAAVTLMLARMGRTGPMLALLFGPPLFAVSAGGNVQPLMVLSLLWGLHRRSGPIWVAVAASMKYTPVLLALTYVARREYARAAWTLVLAAGLLAPGLALGIGSAGVRSGAAESILGVSLPLYVIVVAAACAATLLVSRRYVPISAAVAAVLALPRLFVYDVTLLAAGAARDRARGD